HLLTDAEDAGRIAGAIGFGVRANTCYIFKAKAVIITTGGASNVFRPRSTGEGLGRTWYSVFSTGSAYGLMIPIGTEMTQMEHRFVPTRFKDGYGPVGMWFQYFHARVTNALGEDYTVTRADELKKYEPLCPALPTPTPLRNHQMFLDIQAGLGPMYMRTEEAMQQLAGGDPVRMEKVREEAWEDFLDMNISQGPAGGAGSGPEDMAPPWYFWGYNKMTTRRGLFAAGDGVGAAPHKFSSGSFTEGRLAAKSAVRYVLDHPEAPALDQHAVQQLQQAIWAPLETFAQYSGFSTAEEVNPHYLTPKQGLVRLQKIMDEYAGGTSAWYTTNGPTLQRGIELIEMLRADLQHLAARNQHELLRCWELW